MKIALPKLPAMLDKQTDVVIESEASWEAVCLVAPSAATTAAAVTFDECQLDKPFFVQARMEKVTLRDTRVNGGDLSAARFQESGMQRVHFQDCRMTGFDVSRSTLKDVHFTGCKLTMANMRFAKLTNVVFDDCILIDADFQNAACKNVVFKRCLMERTVIHGAALQQVDVRSSQLIDIRGWKDAKGIILDSAQLMSVASELALALDITVSDD